MRDVCGTANPRKRALSREPSTPRKRQVRSALAPISRNRGFEGDGIRGMILEQKKISRSGSHIVRPIWRHKQRVRRRRQTAAIVDPFGSVLDRSRYRMDLNGSWEHVWATFLRLAEAVIQHNAFGSPIQSQPSCMQPNPYFGPEYGIQNLLKLVLPRVIDEARWREWMRERSEHVPIGFVKVNILKIALGAAHKEYHLRLHLFDQSLQSGDIEGIHSHRWDFESAILYGELKSDIWELCDSTAEDAELRTDIEKTTNDQTGDRSVNALGDVWIRKSDEKNYSAGQTYFFPRKKIHQVHRTDIPSATLVLTHPAREQAHEYKTSEEHQSNKGVGNSNVDLEKFNILLDQLKHNHQEEFFSTPQKPAQTDTPEENVFGGVCRIANPVVVVPGSPLVIDIDNLMRAMWVDNVRVTDAFEAVLNQPKLCSAHLCDSSREHVLMAFLDNMNQADLTELNSMDQSILSLVLDTPAINDDAVRERIITAILQKTTALSLGSRDVWGATTLMHAVNAPFIKTDAARQRIVTAILQKMNVEDVTASDVSGHTALHFAIKSTFIKDDKVRECIVGEILDKMEPRKKRSVESLADAGDDAGEGGAGGGPPIGLVAYSDSISQEDFGIQGEASMILSPHNSNDISSDAFHNIDSNSMDDFEMDLSVLHQAPPIPDGFRRIEMDRDGTCLRKDLFSFSGRKCFV